MSALSEKQCLVGHGFVRNMALQFKLYHFVKYLTYCTHEAPHNPHYILLTFVLIALIKWWPGL